MVKEIENKKKMRKKKFELNYISVIIVISVILAVIVFFFNFFFHFKSGDFVYNKDTELIGEIKGVSLPLNYLIQWQDESFSQEPLFDIGNLKELSDFEVMELLEKDNKYEYSLYPGQIKGDPVILENITGAGNIAGARILLPGSGKGGLTLRVGLEGCKPNFICDKWRECVTEYELYSLVAEELVSGVQYRYCKDYSKCISDFIDSKECDIKIPVDVKKVKIEDKEYIEIYDRKENKLIAKIRETKVEDFKKLDIEFIVV
jgi:hypothetical protein